jgi:hypothetical protein
VTLISRLGEALKRGHEQDVIPLPGDTGALASVDATVSAAALPQHGIVVPDPAFATDRPSS